MGVTIHFEGRRKGESGNAALLTATGEGEFHETGDERLLKEHREERLELMRQGIQEQGAHSPARLPAAAPA